MIFKNTEWDDDMVDRFDLNNLDKGSYCLGILDSYKISLLNLSLQETKIMISNDKVGYTRKHIGNYDSKEEYERLVQQAPEIIAFPDYLGLHPTKQSIEFIKDIDGKIMVLAVRIRNYGVLWVKTIFPITQDKFNLYLQSGSLIAVDKSKCSGII